MTTTIERRRVDAGTDRAAWLESRKQGIGGSDAAACLDMHPWKSALRLYYEKRGEIPLEDAETEAMYWGIALEPAIAAGYSQRTGRRMRRQPMRASREFPFMFANIDRQIIGEPRGPGIYEGKNVNAFTRLSDVRDVPDHYYLQAHHYMAVYGYSWCSIAALVGGNRLAWYDIPRDQEAIDMLIEAERSMWRRIEEGDPPAPDSSDDCRALLNSMRPDSEREIVLPADIAESVVDLADLRGSIKRYEDLKQRRENAIKAALVEANATVGVVPGWGRVTWSQNAPSHRLDGAALRDAQPAVYKEFCRQQPGAIILRLQPAKETKNNV